jgi:hypothetical protein
LLDDQDGIPLQFRPVEPLRRLDLRPSPERLAVFSYIETFYSPFRRRSALGYDSPDGYENITGLDDECTYTCAYRLVSGRCF